MTTTEHPKNVHHGRNIKRFREMFGIKQEALAIDLGADWSQKKVSRLEESEVVEEGVLEQIAQILNIPKEAIKNFSEDAAISYFNSFHDSSVSHLIANHGTYNAGSTEEMLKLVEENKKLYERLVAAEKEKVALLEKMLELKK